MIKHDKGVMPGCACDECIVSWRAAGDWITAETQRRGANGVAHAAVLDAAACALADQAAVHCKPGHEAALITELAQLLADRFAWSRRRWLDRSARPAGETLQ